jgi:hypothetical protein
MNEESLTEITKYCFDNKITVNGISKEVDLTKAKGQVMADFSKKDN